MVSKIKIRSDAQSLQQTDEFIETGFELGLWIHENRTLAITLFALIFIVPGSYLIFEYFQNNQKASSTKELSKAVSALSAQITVTSEGATGEEKKDADKNGIPDSFSSEKEKFQTALSLLETVTKNGNSAASSIALKLSGDCHFALKDYPKAIELYQKFLQNNPISDPLHILAIEGLAYAFEASGQMKQAEDELNKIIQTTKTGTFHKDYANFHLGRIKEMQSQTEEAKKYYLTVKENFQKSFLLPTIENRLALLPHTEAKPEGGSETPKKL